jgi:PAS domain S-box-containing protein
MPAAAGDAPARDGWAALFRSAFVESRNAMVLLDERRRIVDGNGAYLRLVGRPRSEVVGRPVHAFLVGGPVLSDAEWTATLAARRVTGEAEVVTPDGTRMGVQWAASTEVVTGRPFVLVVALSTSRWGPRFRRDPVVEAPAGALTPRELEVVRLIADGATAREIADELHISHDTVRTHVRNAMEKLHARSRAHLVAKALARGIVLV